MSISGSPFQLRQQRVQLPITPSIVCLGFSRMSTAPPRVRDLVHRIAGFERADFNSRLSPEAREQRVVLVGHPFIGVLHCHEDFRELVPAFTQGVRHPDARSAPWRSASSQM